MVEEAIGLDDEGQQIGEQLVAGGLEDENIARADALELGNGSFALVGSALAKST